MKNSKKAIALTVLASLMLGACGAPATTDAPAPAGDDTTAAPVVTTTLGTTTGETLAPTESTEPVTLRMSWWGGDSRHAATQQAVEAFMKKNPHITVEMDYGAWTGWQEKMAVQFSSGTAPDVNQVNWNWLTAYSSDGSVFLDMNKVSNIFDLTQYDEVSLNQCVVAGELQAIPVAMTGRIFYWNTTAWEKAGLKTPTSLEELMAAGPVFAEKLGDDFYPLAMNEYDRTICMVYYLESVYGKPWVKDGALQYTKAEITEGLQWIQDLEDAHVIPSIQTLLGDGAESLDKNPKWMNGTYGGIFEWDSSATKFMSALEEGNTFEVGNYMKDMGSYQGGFSKVSLAMAITENTAHPTESAELLQFLLNDAEGAKIMSSERGIPLSKAALSVCEADDLLNPTVTEANKRVLAWVQFPLDPKFEDDALKATNTGIYWDVMAGVSYGDYTTQDGAEILSDGINDVLQG
jgi:oligogalacturonide transport system substrate-binding protein